MSKFPFHVNFPGRLIFVGFGSIGQGVLPLILRHVGIKPDMITIVTADEAGEKVATEYGVAKAGEVQPAVSQLPVSLTTMLADRYG